MKDYKVVPIISALLIMLGAFTPWSHIESMSYDRGIDQNYGLMILLFGVISGALAVKNKENKFFKYYWIYFFSGTFGYAILGVFVWELNFSVEALAKINPDIASHYSVLNFFRYGLYLTAVGLLGLIWSGIAEYTQQKYLIEKLKNR